MAAAVARPRIRGNLYVLGGDSVCNNAPPMNDAPNSTQCPCGKNFPTSVGGMAKRRILNVDEMPSGAFDCSAFVSFTS